MFRGSTHISPAFTATVAGPSSVITLTLSSPEIW